MLGPAPVLTARLHREDEALRVEDLRLVTDQGLEGSGEGRWGPEGLDARLALTLDALTRLDAGISGGPVSVTLEAHGPLADPALRLEARVPRLDGAGPAWRDVVATLNARGMDAPQGDLTVGGRVGSVPLRASLPFRLETGSKVLTLEGLRLEAGRARGEGKARIDGTTLAASTATLTFDVPDLAALGPLGLPALGGALTGRVAYDGRTLSLDARSPALSSGSARLGALVLKGRIDTPLTRPVVALEASLTGGAAGPATWRHMGIGVKGPLETPAVQASLEGGVLQTPQGSAPLGAALSLRPGKGGTLRLETLEARAGRHRLSLIAPATIKPGAGACGLSIPWRLAWTGAASR
ncbi:hypothetical protein [Pararhodospirillum photometricum]|uniref:hypothetical protein n=1 Tax=Pararhodospirillum photometricum TaxID=1084 RepID=UPI000312CDBC|nr:hypothetical protein [Pararhodospirillum photometricum]